LRPISSWIAGTGKLAGRGKLVRKEK